MPVIEADAVVVGGGATGLSAALTLGRMGREVVVVDAGAQQNRAAHTMHGYLTRDGVTPADFYKMAREELARYPTITVLDGTVTDVATRSDGITATLEEGGLVTSRRLVVATGIADRFPDVDGYAEEWGRSIFSCPYCHAWELRGRRVAVTGTTPQMAIARAVHLRGVGVDTVLLCKEDLAAQSRHAMERLGIGVLPGEVTAVRGLPTGIRVALSGGPDHVDVDGLFVVPGWEARSGLAKVAGCELADDGRIRVDRYGRTTNRVIFAAGDVASSYSVVSQVVRSAGDGSQVGAAVDQDLLLEAIRVMR